MSFSIYQYSVADTIGVQTPGNLAYFGNWASATGRTVEVLQNWLGQAPKQDCTIQVAQTVLAGRKVFVYAGNMGVAQGMDILLDLAQRLRHRPDVGFLFVGRGREAKSLAAHAHARGLSNVLFRDEIHPDEIPALYAQCHIGLVALDPRHKSHHIPGKFLTYIQSGLPVLANINPGNDLAEMIRAEKVGRVSEENSVDALQRLAEELLETLGTDPNLPARCQALFARLFSPATAVKQIVAALSNETIEAGSSPLRKRKKSYGKPKPPKISSRFVRQFAVCFHQEDKTMPAANSTARLEARISTDLHSMLKRAAELQGRTMTDFVVSAVQDAAQRAIEQAEVIRLSLADQECFAQALLSPPRPAPALERAFTRRSKLLRTE